MSSNCCLQVRLSFTVQVCTPRFDRHLLNDQNCRDNAKRETFSAWERLYRIEVTHACPEVTQNWKTIMQGYYWLLTQPQGCVLHAVGYSTFPESPMSRAPTAATKLGMIKGRMRAFSIRRKRWPMYEMYITSRSLHRSTHTQNGTSYDYSAFIFCWTRMSYVSRL